jgi:hypothetical protein
VSENARRYHSDRAGKSVLEVPIEDDSGRVRSRAPENALSEVAGRVIEAPFEDAPERQHRTTPESW